MCAKRTAAAASVERRRCEPTMAISYRRVPKFSPYDSVCCACAEVTKNIILCSMGPKLRYPAVAAVQDRPHARSNPEEMAIVSQLQEHTLFVSKNKTWPCKNSSMHRRWFAWSPVRHTATNVSPGLGTNTTVKAPATILLKQIRKNIARIKDCGKNSAAARHCGRDSRRYSLERIVHVSCSRYQRLRDTHHL